MGFKKEVRRERKIIGMGKRNHNSVVCLKVRR